MTRLPDLLDTLTATGLFACSTAAAGVVLFNLILWVA